MKFASTLTIGALVASIVLFSAPAAEAGRTCEPRALTAAGMKTAVATALRLKRELDAARPEAAIVARVGSDIREYGLKYTHAGFVLWSAEKSKWLVVHQLNLCGTDRSTLMTHGLLEFMLDDPFSYDVQLAFPARDLQRAVAEIVQSGAARRVYQPKYSTISNPRGYPVYQNSNQWMLEVIAQAQGRVSGQIVNSRRQAFAIYQRNGFRGSNIRISGLRRLFAGTFGANLRFDDHPPEAATREIYEVVSVRSVLDYLKRNGLLAGIREIAASAN